MKTWKILKLNQDKQVWIASPMSGKTASFSLRLLSTESRNHLEVGSLEVEEVQAMTIIIMDMVHMNTVMVGMVQM